MKRNPKSVRLSRDVIPSRYEVHLTPDLEAFVFAGVETIHLTLKKPAKQITLHAKELEIDRVEAILKSGTVSATKITFDEKSETATFTFKQPLPKGDVALYIVFHGSLNDKMRGFYRSSFEHNGKTHVIATTQFESTDARQALPCFDEPAMKAIFEVTLTVPSDKEAISNTIPVEEIEHAGEKTLRFAPTPPMSTYLLAFIVGDFEHIEKKSADGVLVRVFTTPGKKEQARFALDCAAKTITFFNKYFAIPYPLPVLDMIAIPDFAAGAMENWGAITYRETALLVDPKNSSTMNKQWVALVIAHEIAHQWFGNLVTMEWWTHLWLNEGFASYIEYLAVDKLFPSWDMWTQFLYHDMRPAFHLDALKHTHPIEVEVHHPSEIAAVFDAVSYSKGATIIRMLAEHLGEKHFRDGLRYYLKKHRYGNTETEDLWHALEHVSGKPVEKMMAAWTAAEGYPLVSVSEKGNELTLSQKRFFSSPISDRENREKTLWQIPVGIVSDTGKPVQHLIGKASAKIAKPRGTWIKVNARETGFYRTHYSPALREALAGAARTKKLNTRDRLGLIRDIFALAENGTAEAVDALAFAENYRGESAYVAWAEIASSLASMHSLLAHETFLKRFEDHALDIFSMIGKKFSWNTVPKDHSDSLLKVLVVGSLGKYGDQKVRAHAQKLFRSAEGKKNSIAADLRGIVYGIVARHGGAPEHAQLIRMYTSSPLQEEKNRIGAALGNFRNLALLEKTLAFAMTDEVRLQDKTRVIAGVTVNPVGHDLAWEFVQKHWQTFVQKYAGTRDLLQLIEPLRVSSSKKRAQELQQFLRKNPAAGMERTLQQVLEQIQSNALWIERNQKPLEQYLK